MLSRGSKAIFVIMKKLCLVLFTLGLSVMTIGQYNLDYGIKAGAANYLGEIGGDEKSRRDFIWDMRLNQTRYATGAFVRYKYSPLLSINAGLTYLRIKGDDSESTNLGRRSRNLNFRNDIFELSTRAEINVYGNNDLGNRGWYKTDLKAFVFAGVGGFYHNPKASNPNTRAVSGRHFNRFKRKACNTVDLVSRFLLELDYTSHTKDNTDLDGKWVGQLHLPIISTT